MLPVLRITLIILAFPFRPIARRIQARRRPLRRLRQSIKWGLIDAKDAVTYPFYRLAGWIVDRTRPRPKVVTRVIRVRDGDPWPDDFVDPW